MKSLPTLFSRTSTGAVQQWTVQIDGNKFRVESGQTDGKKVLSEWTVCEPKNVGRANATTAEEQALSEAEAKWDKKLKTGYTTDVKKIDECTSYIEPMLAKDFERLSYQDGLEEWLDCFRTSIMVFAALLHMMVSVLFSRAAKVKNGLAFRISIRTWKSSLRSFSEAVLDGELYNYDLRQKLNELTKLVRKTKEYQCCGSTEERRDGSFLYL